MLGKYDETLIVDWGLAKPFERDETSRNGGEEPLTPSAGSGSDTPTVGAVGTPAYMSPEQAEVRASDIGPGSDLFSLGAILYAILTGHVPYRGRTPSEVLDKVKRCEFPKPRQLKPEVPGALEAVCLKAMAANPGDRYATALDLAADVKRWLANEPVSAWREPALLRSRRWMRRHRALVTTTAAVLVVGVVGLAGFSTVVTGKNRELDAKNLALVDKNRQLDIRNVELAGKNQELEKERHRAEAREELAIDAVKKFRDAVQGNLELKNRPELDALRKALLNEPMEFFRNLRDQLQSDHDTRPNALARLARANRDLASTIREIGSLAGALQSCAESIAILEQLTRDYPSVAQYQNDLGVSRNNLGLLLSETSQPGTAIESHQKALQIRERLAADYPAVPEYQNNLAISHNNIANLWIATGRRAEALELHQKALAIRERLVRDHPAVLEYQCDLAKSRANIGNLLNDTGRPAEALESDRQAVKEFERLARDNPKVTAYRDDQARSHNDLGAVLSETGNPAEAMESHGLALALRQQLVHDHPTITEYQCDLAVTHRNIGGLLYTTGHRSLALESFQAAVLTCERLVRDHPSVTRYQSDLAANYNDVGVVLEGMGHPALALESHRRARPIRERLARDNPSAAEYDRHLALSLHNIGRLLYLTAHPAEALESHRRALLIRERLARDNPSVHSYQSHLGASLQGIAEIEMGQGRWLEAREHLERAIAQQRLALAAMPRNPTYQLSFRDHLLNLTRLFQALNQPNEAVRSTRELVALSGGSPIDLYNVACAIALTVTIARGEQQQTLAAEAVETLKQAVAAGWSDAQHTSRDPDLFPLRDRDDFRRLLAGLFDRGFPADPIAK
jgi:eukaryotic-like serine/threonine-protein kinase